MKQTVPVQDPKYKPRHYFKFAVALLAVMHIAGLVGYMTPAFRLLFLSLTPFNLFFTAAALVFFQAQHNKAFLIFIITASLAGFTAEAIGVNTGLLFGDYQYGETLGVKAAGVPFVIGLNWFSLTCIAGTLCARLPVSSFIRAATGALLLVALDVVIEPVATAFDFWSWKDNIIPWGNYLGWMLIAFLILFIFYQLKFDKKNPIALPLLIIQWGFFIVLFLYLHIV